MGRKEAQAPSKRMLTADLRAYLNHLSNTEHTFILSSKQCGLLIEAMQRVSLWLAQWERVSLSASFVLHLLTLATKGVRLLHLCQHVEPASWLFIAASRLENKGEFFHLFQGFLQALNGYIEVMQGPFPVQKILDSPSSSSSPISSISIPDKRCIDEAASVIASLNENLHFLEFKAAEDRRSLFERLEQSSVFQGEEWKISQFLMERLEDKQKCAAAFQLDMKNIQMGKRIGVGTYGAVYEAVWMGMHVAVKQFLYKASLDAELSTLLKVDHVNMIQALGYVPQAESSKPCLVMERMKGDLGQFVERLQTAKSELPLMVTIEILLQVATGMAHLHAKDIVHRDLKPENILFDRWPPMSTRELNRDPGDFTAKITDFGDCRIQTYDTTVATAKRGTACYRAPEVLSVNENGRARYSNKVDVYSFGMVCYKLLTGSDPVLSFEEARHGDCSGLPFPSNIPRALIFFIQKCWTRSHQHRPSFVEICDFLSFFKSILLNTRPIDGRMPPLNFGLRSDLVAKLVAFLGKEWLMDEAISLGIKPAFEESINRLEINEWGLQVEVSKKLATLPERRFLTWNCCFPGLPLLIG
ncbi:hypothetical protein GOP47_0014204 [Adiantum capillus-veneris]|uniref:Protein kinase domain-containing protein n=1 Tax=Adiantum capillus-veneris TaxID=13818 RepID=A0A9D4UQ04_ADICA|nr:hypothetical protein GOP47_0014204 [Adiantum capillus-veneris]